MRILQRDAFVSLRSMEYWRFTSERLIARNLAFHQSKSEVNIQNLYHGHHNRKHIRQLYRNDWFHIFLRWPTLLSLLMLLSLWTAVILFFGALYVAYDRGKSQDSCSLWPSTETSPPPRLKFYTAFVFSLETETTVGYALPGKYRTIVSTPTFVIISLMNGIQPNDVFVHMMILIFATLLKGGSQSFFECPLLQFLSFFNMGFNMLFSAFLVHFFYARLSRAETRSSQILFSNKAVVRKDSTGKLILEVRVYNIDEIHPVVEERVRMMVVNPSSTNESFRRTNYARLRILSPNDELTSPLFTSLPSMVVHHIDSYSPLVPPKYRPEENNETIVGSFGLSLREVDCWTGMRDRGIPCPTCGVGFSTYEKLWDHIRTYQLIDKNSKMEIEGSHQQLGDVDDDKNKSMQPKTLSLSELQDFWRKSNMEVVVVVEGIDPMISGSFMALQSYQKDDIVFGAEFENCLKNDGLDRCVDFDLFHKIAGIDSEE